MTERKIMLPFLSLDPDAPALGAQCKIAMHSIDAFLRHANDLLKGRDIVPTRGALRGKVLRIDHVAIASGASGMHVLVAVDGSLELFEIGVTCELLKEGDA